MYQDIRHTSPHLAHPVHAKPGIMPFPDKLHVITPIVNTQRFARRYELYRAFEKHMAESGVILYTAELAFGNREFEITNRSNPLHMQFRTPHELWYKENLVNAAITRLPPEAKYIAWIDADLSFSRQDWAQETLQELQHHKIVQMFSNIIYLSYNSEILSQGTSFMEGWRQGIPIASSKGIGKDEDFFRKLKGKDLSYYQPGSKGKIAAGWPGAPGGAWAARREAIDELGGLIDYTILGAGDHYMAAGLMGFAQLVIRAEGCPEYVKMLLEWQANALETIQRNVGHVKGTISHHWHGSRDNRQYGTRGGILTKHGFNPRTDLKKDAQGLWQLTSKKWQLREDIHSYFGARNEDELS